MKGMIQVVLSDASQAALRKLYNGFKHETKHGHHLTVAFRPKDDDPLIEAYPEGTVVVMDIVGYAVDDKGEAVLVEGVDSKNKNPHITLSCAAGVSPVYSNELLANADVQKVETEIGLMGTVKHVFFK